MSSFYAVETPQYHDSSAVKWKRKYGMEGIGQLTGIALTQANREDGR